MHWHNQLLINYGTRRRHAFFVFLAMLVLSPKLSSQSEVIDKLRKSKLAHRTFVLYPSTIRMINVPQLESYYKTFADVEKVLFFKLRRDFNDHDYLQTIADLEDKEGFEELLQVDLSAGDNLLLLHREKSSETVLLSQRDGVYFSGTFLGKIDLMQLISLVGDLQDPDIIKDNPLLQFLYESGFTNRRDRRQDTEQNEVKKTEEVTKSKT